MIDLNAILATIHGKTLPELLSALDDARQLEKIIKAAIESRRNENRSA